MPFVIPGAASGTESLVLDGLDLAQGPSGVIMLQAFSPPLFKKRLEWVEAADSDGAVLARDPLMTVGDATVTVAIAGASRDDANTAIASIVAKLEEADRNPDGIPLVWTPSDGTVSGTAYVLTGEITELPVDWESGYMANQPTVTFTLSCAPGWYTTAVTYTGTATAGPLVTLDLADVPGDVPSPATLTITESSSQSRRTVEWGSEHAHYSPGSPWPLILDSDSLVTSGFAGTQQTAVGSYYDPNGTGSNLVSLTLRGANVTYAVAGTGVQSHVGSFRVKARVNSALSSVWYRLSWQAGDGTFKANDWAQPPLVKQLSEVDLGIIDIPAATVGAQQWTGRVEAYSTVASGAALTIDYLEFIPLGAGYGRARGSHSPTASAISAYDGFDSITAGTVLNARVSPIGGTWATSGSTTDFAAADGPLVGQESMVRSTVSDTGQGRLAVLGTAVFAATYAKVEMSVTAASGGLLLRYVDASDHVRVLASYDATAATASLTVIKRVAGVDTELGTVSRSASLGGLPAIAVEAYCFPSGRVIATISMTTGVLLVTADVIDSDLATGGTLDDGKVGIVDLNASATARTRYYDNFSAGTPTEEPVALYAGRGLKISSTDTLRESSSGGTWGRPATYRGSRFLVNPAGDADRTTRVAVKALRNDLAVGAYENLTDQIALSVSVTPRYALLPRP